MEDAAPSFVRRAQPLLGTLVEIGLPAAVADRERVLKAAFDAIWEVQACLSRFEPTSDIARFHVLPVGPSLALRAPTLHVLACARELQIASAGLFDITVGSAPLGWCLDGERVQKLDAAARIDLGGIGKGHAVDCAVQALVDHGCAAGWVNAGGDLRAFGAAELPIMLRDEDGGGVRPFASLHEGAFATSHFDRCSRSQVHGRHPGTPVRRHASVAAPLCIWADAMTKVVALSGDASHPLLARYDARAWLH